jgi:hypothetical protein
MTTERKNSMYAGILLLLGFSGVGIVLALGNAFQGPGFVGNIHGNEARFVWAAVFQLFMAFACSGIVVFLYPSLKRVNEAWALWALVLRSFETVLFIAAALALLSFPALGRAFSGAGMAERPGLQALGTVMKDSYDWASAVLGILAWSLGALIYHVLLFKGRIVPRWLSVWGIIGAPFSVAACMLAIFGTIPIDSTANTLLTLPLGLQEIPLAIWLIVKGTRSTLAGV